MSVCYLAAWALTVNNLGEVKTELFLFQSVSADLGKVKVFFPGVLFVITTPYLAGPK